MILKVISLNIFEGGIFFTNILNFLRREKPDVFCLQEVYNGSDASLPNYYQTINTLQKALPNYSCHFSPEFLSQTVEGKIEVGNATFSRFPILEKSTHFFRIPYGEYPQVSPNHDYSQHPCNMQHTVIKAAGKKVDVFNVHGVWGLDGADNADRLYMSNVITKQIEGKKLAMLMGDFNVKPETTTIRNIEKYMINVFKGNLPTSFNLTHKDLKKYPGYATAVVDMFFISKDLNVVSKRVPTDNVSDHLPLLCEIEIS